MDLDQSDQKSKTTTVTVTGVEDETLTLPPTAGLDFLWREARAQFLDQLPSRHRQHEEALVEDTTLDDTVKTLSAAKTKAENAYGTKFKGKPVEIKLNRVLHRLEFILRFGDAAVKFAPESASCVWAAFRLLASAVSQDFDSCQFLIDAIDQISDIILVCEVYAKRQLYNLTNLTDDSCLMADKVLEKIPPLLALVLKFAYETRRLVVDKGRFSRAFSILFGGAQELKDIFSDAETKRDELNRAAGIAFHEAVIQMLQATQQDTGTIIDYLTGLDLTGEELMKSLKQMGQRNEEMAENVNEISGNVQEIMLEQLRERSERERRDLDDELKEQLSWLRSEGVAALHEPVQTMDENLRRRYPGTCEWISMDERFSSWRGSHRANISKKFLWLSGEAGFGKSVLMSYIMEHLERQATLSHSKDKPLVLRFFCKLGNDAFQKVHKMIGHLISQLLDLSSLEDDFELKQRCMELARKLKTDAFSGETRIRTGRVSLLHDLLRTFKRPIYMLIDGLDECEDRNNSFLASLVTITQSALLDVRLLVSSRPERDIHEAFAEHDPTRVDVEKEVTEKDVEAYIAGSLRTITRFDQSKRRRAAVEIARKAAGMFRYANLAVDSLKSPAALRRSFKQLMDGLPDGLANLYEQEIRALEPPKREILLVALRWLVCGEGGISLTLIADELEGNYLHDDSDSDSEAEEDGMGYDNEKSTTDMAMDRHTPALVLGVEDEKDLWEMGVEPERDCIRHLKLAGRNFLKIDKNGIVTLQHTSVRDYIISRSEASGISNREALCARCRGLPEPLSTADAGLKRGHLTIALRCLKLINCPVFQREFLPRPTATTLPRGDADPNADSIGASREIKNTDGLSEDDRGRFRETSHCSSDEPSYYPYEDFGESRLPFSASASNGNISQESTKNATRYELTHWHYHVTAAEGLWPEDERGTEEWIDLYGQTERFLDDIELFQIWHRKIVSQQLVPVKWLPDPAKDFGLQQLDFRRGSLPIHFASQYGIIHYIHLYVQRGGAVDVEDDNGYTPLHLACSDKRGHVAVPVLVRHGASVNKLARGINQRVVTPLVCLVEAQGLVTLVQYLLDYGADITVTAGLDGSVLKSAIQVGNFDTVKALLAHAQLRDKSPTQKEALNVAFHHTLPTARVVEIFLNKQDDANSREYSAPALHWAVRSHGIEIAEMLLEAGASVDAEESTTGQTALHRAIARHNVDLVDLLLKHGANILKKDKDSHNAIWHAANFTSEVILQRLLDVLKSNPDAESSLYEPDRYGRIPLHNCDTPQYVETARLLLSAGDSQTMLSHRDLWGNTPLHWAAIRQIPEVAAVLLERGADRLSVNSAGQSALDLAVHVWNECPQVYRSRQGVTVLLLLDNGVPLSRSLRPILLVLATHVSSAQLCRRMVDLDSRLAQQTDKHGWTPLMVALQNRDHEVSRVLLPFDGANPTAPIANRNAKHGHPPSGWGPISEGLEPSGNLELRKAPCPSQTYITPQITNHPIQFGVSRYYWELELVEARQTAIGLGFAPGLSWLNEGPVFNRYAYPGYVYCSKHGKVIGIVNALRTGPTYEQGDTVGCGIDFVKGVIFFTKNGVLLGDGVERFPPGRLFPVVVINEGTALVRANFGTDPNKPFMYDANEYGKEREHPTGFVVTHRGT